MINVTELIFKVMPDAERKTLLARINLAGVTRVPLDKMDDYLLCFEVEAIRAKMKAGQEVFFPKAFSYQMG